MPSRTSILLRTSSSSAMRSRAEILRWSTCSISALPFTSMAALMHDEFLKGRESLVIAGTHGKTTTTSMLAWIYQVAARENPALEPSFLIGGVAENFGTSFQLRPTRTFIIEGDEYDTAFFDKGPKFLHYFPDALDPHAR